jgi:hypothetical protein
MFSCGVVQGWAPGVSRTVAILVSVVLLLGVGLGGISTFLIFHGSKSSPESSQAIPVVLRSPVVPYPRSECSRNQLLDSSLALRSRCERERLLHPTHAQSLLATDRRGHRTPAGFAPALL